MDEKRLSKLAFEYHAKYRGEPPDALMELTNTPMTTTYNRLRMLKSKGTLARQVGSGRRPIFDKAQVRRIISIVKKNPMWPAAAIANEAHKRGMPLVSKATMVRTLNKAGLAYLKPRICTDLKDHH